MTQRQYEFHPLANIFPLIEGQAFTDLVADVKAHGVRDPVWLHEGKILDGRNRYRASIEAGVPCKFTEYTGQDATAFVISLNLHRRHLSEAQRAMVAAKLANMVVGGKEANSANLRNSVSQATAASMLNVSERSVTSAKKVIDSAPKEIAKAVEQGEMSINLANKVIALPAKAQERIIAAAPDKIKEVAQSLVAQANPGKFTGTPKKSKASKERIAELKAAQERGVSMLCSYAQLLIEAIEAADSFTPDETHILAELQSAINQVGVTA